MKSNAPERIYVCDNVFPSHVDWDGSPINTKRIDDHDIEYVRKDAFIEKACSWLNKELPITDLSPSNMLDIAFKVFDRESKKVFIESFRKYMKESKA